YKLLGDENLEVKNLLVEGKENATINKLVPSILGGIFKGAPKGLPPAANRDPQYDNRDDGPNGTQIPQQESHLTADDVLACNVVDNGDGTINITFSPRLFTSQCLMQTLRDIISTFLVIFREQLNPSAFFPSQREQLKKTLLLTMQAVQEP
ncbi:MAG: hypothetical protein IJ927_04635, partial [Eubacterium sp.]|nr:hypothetical protein [Eubacterium sp.]